MSRWSCGRPKFLHVDNLDLDQLVNSSILCISHFSAPFSTIDAVSYTSARYRRGLGPVFLNNLQCSGLETNLTECSRSQFGQSVSSCRDHSRDVSISCGSKTLHCFIIRPSVDGLCRDGPSEISRDPRTKRLQTQPKRLGWL